MSAVADTSASCTHVWAAIPTADRARVFHVPPEVWLDTGDDLPGPDEIADLPDELDLLLPRLEELADDGRKVLVFSLFTTKRRLAEAIVRADERLIRDIKREDLKLLPS